MEKEELLAIRKEWGLTQRAFAEAVQCSYSLIALVESGKRRITDALEKKVKTEFLLENRQR